MEPENLPPTDPDKAGIMTFYIVLIFAVGFSIASVLYAF